MQGNGFIGIGVELGVKDNNLTIIAPLPDSPAKQAGIRAGDIVLSINNTAVTDMSEEQVVAALRGVRGSSVELTIHAKAKSCRFISFANLLLHPASVQVSATI